MTVYYLLANCYVHTYHNQIDFTCLKIRLCPRVLSHSWTAFSVTFIWRAKFLLQKDLSLSGCKSVSVIVAAAMSSHPPFLMLTSTTGRQIVCSLAGHMSPCSHCSGISNSLCHPEWSSVLDTYQILVQFLVLGFVNAAISDALINLFAICYEMWSFETAKAILQLAYKITSLRNIPAPYLLTFFSLQFAMNVVLWDNKSNTSTGK